MTYAETLLPEFDQEMAKTRKVLERIPDDRLDWQPHPKSHTIGWNANHVADLPNWLAETLRNTSFDVAPVGGEPYKVPNLGSRQEILDHFDRNVATARKAIAEIKDEDVGSMWSLLKGGQPIFSMPRSAVVRGMVLNHLIHHRAVVCVYLRLNDIPVPGMYGPSGDE
ncbi:MAG: DinB family protein [Isosphaeraceae bacterium]